MNDYEEIVKEVLSGKHDNLELECEDNAFLLPVEKFDEEVESNIRCLLGDAGLLNKNLVISVLPLPNDVDCDDETGQCMVSQNFTIYKDNGWEPLAMGTAVTTYYMGENEKYVDVARTYIVMPGKEVKKLYDYVKMGKLKWGRC